MSWHWLLSVGFSGPSLPCVPPLLKAFSLPVAGSHKQTRTGDDLRILRRRQRHLDHIDAKQRCIRILVRRLTRTPCQLFALTDERRSRDVDVDVVLVVRIDDERMRVRAAASLHRCHLLRILDVGDVENSHAAETIFLRCRRRRLFILSVDEVSAAEAPAEIPVCRNRGGRLASPPT